MIILTVKLLWLTSDMEIVIGPALVPTILGIFTTMAGVNNFKNQVRMALCGVYDHFNSKITMAWAN